MLGRAAPPHRDQDEAGREQRGQDQRIGAAMGVARVADIGGQRGVAPEVDDVEHGLQGEQQIEQDQRTQHR